MGETTYRRWRRNDAFYGIIEQDAVAIVEAALGLSSQQSLWSMKASLARNIAGIAAGEERKMNTVPEIQQAILELSKAEYDQLSLWFHELNWERWDAEIERDSRDGKLDTLVVQAAKAKADGALQEL